MKINKILLFAILQAIVSVMQAQRTGGVCISDSLTEAHESAMLHLVSTNKGLLLPTVTIAERDKIIPLTEGLTLFIKDIGNSGFQYWNGEKWIGLEVINEQKASIIAPLGGIIMYHGLFENFDGTGKGLPGTEMEGWQLCNGKNGSPDFSGRFIVGGGEADQLTGKDPKYAKIGEKNTVTNNNFSIGEANLPPHSHSVDQTVVISHTHTHELYSDYEYNYKNKKMRAVNSHSHAYGTKADGSRDRGKPSRRNDKNNDIGSRNLSATLDLRDYSVANTSPKVAFTVNGEIIEEFKGVDLKFDNRPRYYVLAFIIRIDDNVNEGSYKGTFEIKY